MKNIKRALALLLAVVFVLGLSACGQDESDNTSTTTATQAESQTVSETGATGGSTVATTKGAAGTTAKKQAATITDRAGQSTIANLITRTTNKKGNASASFVNSLKGYDLKIYYPWSPDIKQYKGKTLGDTAQYCINQVQDEFGVTISEDGVFEQYNELLTAKLAARRAECQIYMVQNFNFASYFKNNYISDLSAAMNTAGVDFKDPWYAQDASAFFNINYKQYGWIAFDAEFIFPFSVVYNKTLMNKAKLTDPATLAEQGKWTWAKFEEYAKKLTTSRVVGLGGDYTNLFATMCAQQGASLVNVKKGQSPTTNISNQKVKNALTQLSKWCKDDAVFNKFSGKDWTYGKTQFAAGNVAMLFTSHDAIKSLTGKSVTDDFGIVAAPTPTESKSFTNVSIPQFVCFIPSQFQSEAAKALFLRNELYRHSYRFAQRNFQVLWGDYFDDEDVLATACNLKYARGNNKTVFNWLSVVEESGGKSSTGKIIEAVISSGQSVQTAIDSYKSSLDTAYKDVWDGYKITGNV